MARRFRPLTPERLGDLPPGCDGCTFWESARKLEPKCGAACDEGFTREWMIQVADAWGDCGLVAVEDGEPLGFVKYAPARFFPQVQWFAAGRPSDDAVLIACMHIRSEARQKGLGKVLYQAALRDLVSRGEKAVEAYAIAGPVDYAVAPTVGVDFLLRMGFTVARPHPELPLLRLELKSLAVWTENLEAVLESLRIPLGAPQRVPAPYIKPRG